MNNEYNNSSTILLRDEDLIALEYLPDNINDKNGCIKDIDIKFTTKKDSIQRGLKDKYYSDYIKTTDYSFASK